MRNAKWSHAGFGKALLLAALSIAACTAAEASAAALTAAQIVERNVEARGGLAAWRAVRSMSMEGLMDAGRVRPQQEPNIPDPRASIGALRHLRTRAVGAGAPAADDGKVVQLPFSMELKRPRKMRLELQFQGQTAVQVYDGRHGWKLRPFLGRNDVEPYTEEETKLAAQQQDLDGYLIDHAAKGTAVALEGVEQVEGRDTYKLKLTLKSGDVRHVWVDTHTFLEARIDGTRRLDGKPRTVMTYLRDYKRDAGLMLPHLLETRVDGVKDPERIVVERVALNPAIADSRFTSVK